MKNNPVILAVGLGSLLVCSVLGISVPLKRISSNSQTVAIARIHASYRYGDKKPPLEDAEELEWFQNRGWSKNPRIIQYEEYVAECERGN